jgi:hypothetical protein
MRRRRRVIMSKKKRPLPQGSQTTFADKRSPDNAVRPPEEILKAVQSGDVKSLKELLAREHRKSMPDAADLSISEENVARFLEQPGMEKDPIDSILKIASDNGLPPDCLLVRALKVYVREYQRTGRL